MTGTIGNSGSELATIYGTPVLEIPTHRPPQRRALPDRVFATAEEKWRAIADEVAQLHREGRPVLIGTRSIDKSIDLSNRLTSLHIEHHVLNAKEHEPEAEIIAHAGEFRRVTVATNMAGRGTDIRLDAASLELGGLHVICSELHESARIDRQLIGRCGRQGDPGSFRQYMSLEDELLDQGLSEKRVNQLRRLSSRHPRQWERYAGLFRSAQRKIEANNFQARKILMYLESQQHVLQTEMGLDPYLDAPSS
jgi:preprotein translocase subunit SecA